LPFWDVIAPYRDQVFQKAGEVVSSVGGFLVSSLAATTRGTVIFIFMLFVMLYAMYFFLLDGRKVLDKILYYMPLTAKDENRMVERFVSVTRATVKGTLIIGIVQGTLAGLAFWVAGANAAVFWGTIMAVLSIIPGVGAALVWVPAVIYLAVSGHMGAAIGLFIWCAGLVGTVDNVLRPWLVGKDTKMPDLLILVSTLGGIVLFGALGVIIGPIIAALFITVWDIYGTTFEEILPPVRPATE
jgi:predicted PurR-regulated permease PerM